MASDDIHNLHIFDCDGVLLDSNTLKIDALRAVFMSIEAPITFVDWAAEEFRTNFGRTRKQHFDVFRLYDGSVPFELSPEKMLQAMKLYGEKVELLYENCSVIPETLSFISELSADDQVYVVSASDQSELRDILPSKILGLKKDNIFGGPASKVDNILKVIKMAGDKKAIFYGDAVQDARASIGSGVSFLGLSKYAADRSALESFCTENKLLCINSLQDTKN